MRRAEARRVAGESGREESRERAPIWNRYLHRFSNIFTFTTPTTSTDDPSPPPFLCPYPLIWSPQPNECTSTAGLTLTVAGRSFQPAWYREAEKPREHFRLRLLLLRIRLPQPHCSYTLYLQVYRYTWISFFCYFFPISFFPFSLFFLFLPRLPSPLPFISKGYHLYPLLVSFFSHPSFRSCLLFAIFVFSLPRVHTTASPPPPTPPPPLLSRSCTTGRKLNPVIILFDRSGVD